MVSNKMYTYEAVDLKYTGLLLTTVIAIGRQDDPDFAVCLAHSLK